LNRRIEIHDRIPIVTPLEEFEEWVDDPHFSFQADSRLAVDRGDVVGFARLWHRPSSAGQSRVFLMGGVEPSHRRQGVGSALLEWEMGRGREILTNAQPDLPSYLRTTAFDFETDAIALYERHGLDPVRYFYDLIRPLDELDPIAGVGGIDIVAWDPERNEELRQVSNAAFADHWGSTPLDPEAWMHRLSTYGTRLDLSFMALDDDVIVGLLLASHYPDDMNVTGRLDGWIFQLGTLRSRRRLGIASALVMTACHAFRDHGFSHAALGVDSENPTGANRLYERLGFAELHRSVQHQMEV
ncbi:MAG: GNAT family N-acetyltransferase, partial [Acidimicrobiia bacterium]